VGLGFDFRADVLREDSLKVEDFIAVVVELGQVTLVLAQVQVIMLP